MSKYLREKFGLTQEKMAEWLDMPRSMLAHYERYTRKLPGAASEKHTKIMVIMANMEKAKLAKAGSPRKPHPDTHARLDHVAKEIKFEKEVAAYKASKLKIKLSAIKKQYEQTRDLLELLEKLMKQSSKEKNKRDHTWLEVQYADSTKRLLSCDEAAQLNMKRKIAMLEAAAAVEVE